MRRRKMANNDRLGKANKESTIPGWKPDEEVTIQTPLVSRAIDNRVGWDVVEDGEMEPGVNPTRTVVTKDSYGLAGWRSRVFEDATQAQITIRNPQLAVGQQSTDGEFYPIQSGAYIKKGSILKVFPNSNNNVWSVPAGARVVVQREGNTDLNYWIDNFDKSRDPGTWVLNEDCIIDGEVRQKAVIAVACSTEGTANASVSVNSWGPKGSQTYDFGSLTKTFKDSTPIETFVDDQFTLSVSVDSAYDWCNLVAGPNPNSLSKVSPTSVGDTGGTYRFYANNTLTYIGMDTLKPIKFYLYQPWSNDFVNVQVDVYDSLDIRVHRAGYELETRSDIDFGKNGVAGNHRRLYPGMRLEVYTTGKAYMANVIADGATVALDSTEADVPIPTETSGYTRMVFNLVPCDIYTIGLCYIKSGVSLGSKTLKRSRQTVSYADFTADSQAPVDYLNDNVQVVEATWGLPSGAVAGWLSTETHWSFEQTCGLYDQNNPAPPRQDFDNADSGSLGDGTFKTGEMPNGIFNEIAWQGGITALAQGEGFEVSIGAQCANIHVNKYPGAVAPWFWELILEWTIYPVAIVCQGDAG